MSQDLTDKQKKVLEEAEEMDFEFLGRNKKEEQNATFSNSSLKDIAPRKVVTPDGSSGVDWGALTPQERTQMARQLDRSVVKPTENEGTGTVDQDYGGRSKGNRSTFLGKRR